MDKVFEYLSIEFRIPLTDFPDVNETRRRLAKYTNIITIYKRDLNQQFRFQL